ncbi:monocarboxylate transporter 3-like [Rhopilema esculentum]|uniref:monocarboxylate transporter 3-like n=1 Tax=Rhopilema esculentum TaxID=499914 RepID=UPI0031DFB211
MDRVEEEEVESSKFRYLVCGFAFLIQFTGYGFNRTFGSIYVSMQKEFDASNASIALASSLPASLLFMLSTVAVVILDRIGFRLSMLLGGILIGVALLVSSFTSNILIIYLTLGVVFAFGQSLCYYGSLLILPLYFKKTLPLAHSIAISGNSVGGLALAPIVGFVLKQYGFGGGMRLCSAVALFIIAMSVVFKRPGESFWFNGLICEENERQSDNESEPENIPLHKNKAFVIYVVSTMCCKFGVYINYVHIVRLALDRAVPYTEATFLPGLASIAQFFGKIAFGKLSAMKVASNLALCQISSAFMGVLMFLPFLKWFFGLAIISFVFGFAQGMFSASNLIIVKEIVGTQQFKRGYIISQFFTGIATFCGPPVAGYLYTVTGNYILVFLIAGGCAVMGMLLMFLVRFFHAQNIEENESPQTVEAVNVIEVIVNNHT